MAKIRTEFLSSGMKLGEDIRDQDGGIVYPKGTTLDDKAIQDLKRYDIYCPEIHGPTDAEVDEIYENGASEDQVKLITKMHEVQFSLCVGFDPFVKELKKISRRSLFASLRS